MITIPWTLLGLFLGFFFTLLFENGIIEKGWIYLNSVTIKFSALLGITALIPGLIILYLITKVLRKLFSKQISRVQKIDPYYFVNALRKRNLKNKENDYPQTQHNMIRYLSIE